MRHVLYLLFLLLLTESVSAISLQMKYGEPGIGSIWIGSDSHLDVLGSVKAVMYGNTVVFAVAEEKAYLDFGENARLKAYHISYNITVEESFSPPLPPEEVERDRIETQLPSNTSFVLECEKGSRIILYGENMCSVDLETNNPMKLSFCRKGTEFHPMEPDGYNLTTRLPGGWCANEDMVPCSLSSPLIKFDGTYRIIICGPDAFVPPLSEWFLTGVWETREKGYWYDPVTDQWILPGTHRVVHVEYIEVEVKGSVFSMPLQGFQVSVYAEETNYRINGSIRADNATGNMQISMDRYRIENEELELSGDFLLQPEAQGDRVAFHCSNEFTWISTPRFSKDYSGIVKDVSLLAVLAAVASYVFNTAKRFLFVPLYTRINRENALNLESRRKVYETIEKNPGICMEKLMEATGIGWGALCYNLRVLQREGFISFQRSGRQKKWFVSTYDSDKKMRVCVIENPINKKILEILSSKRWVTQKRIVKLTGFAQSTVSTHVKILEGAGLIRKERRGKYTRCYPCQEKTE